LDCKGDFAGGAFRAGGQCTIGFLLIALLVMGLAGAAGNILAKAVHCMGLGCLNKIAGAAFGFLQGALLVTLFILVTIAFFPRAHWLAEARLPRLFFGACHLSTRMSPADLARACSRDSRCWKKNRRSGCTPASRRRRQSVI
jgi:hypothetical protein